MRNHASTQQAKIDWLLKHQELWEGWPSGNDANKDPRQKSIVDEMRKVGLVSKSTYWPDIALTNLITEARRQRRLERKPQPMNLVYAGVGSRETPHFIQKQMAALAYHLSNRGWTLRSGGAEGADTAFEKGNDLWHAGNKQIFLPWCGFNNNTSPLWFDKFGYDLCTQAYQIASTIHPRWDWLKYSHKKLHARNVFQVLGPRLVEPVRFVVCWTKDGKAEGGTATAINLAKSRGIPVFNMGAEFYFPPEESWMISDSLF